MTVGTGPAWLPHLPDGWMLGKLMGLVEEVKNPNSGMKNQNLLSLSYGNIVRKDIDSSEGLRPESYETYNVIAKNDIVLRLTDLQNDQVSLRSGLAREDGIVTSAYVTVRPNETLINPSFLAYFLRFTDLTKVIYSLGSGLRSSMSYSDLRSLPIALPSRLQQNEITDFLDRETAEIDAFIADQERLIEILEERRDAVVQQLVTQGCGEKDLAFDPKRPWLGYFPVAWPVVPLRAFLEETDERAGERSMGLPLLSVSIHSGVVPRNELTDRVSRAEDFSNYRVCHKDDLVLNRMRAFQGGLGIAPMQGLVSPDYMVCHLNERIVPEYCYHLLRSSGFVAQMIRALRGLGDVEQGNARTPRINPGDFLRCRVSLPTVAQQENILTKISDSLTMIDPTIKDAQRSIELSRERRSALISAAVTGQLDVCSELSEGPVRMKPSEERTS